MKMLTAFTYEADDKTYAIKEILEQLDRKSHLQANSAGILYCHPDFIQTGVAQAIAEAMPFDVIGCTSIANFVNEADGSLMLSLTVLTGDEVDFSTFTAPGVVSREQMDKAYRSACDGKQDTPKLIVSLLPLVDVEMHKLMAVLDDVSGGVPIFGGAAVDHTNDYHQCFTLCNGTAKQDQMVSLIVWGECEPTFFVSDLSSENMISGKGKVTASEGIWVKKINGMCADQYLTSLGIISQNGNEGLLSSPFMVDNKDGTPPTLRAVYSITREGYADFGTHINQGAEISLCNINRADALSMTEKTVNAAMQREHIQGILMHPCVSYYLMIGVDGRAENEIIKRGMAREDVPYAFAYTGCELCPVKDARGKWVNRFHNYTFVACIF